MLLLGFTALLAVGDGVIDQVVNCLMPSNWFIENYSFGIKELDECVSSHFCEIREVLNKKA
jgi:hypothetical protein